MTKPLTKSVISNTTAIPEAIIKLAREAYSTSNEHVGVANFERLMAALTGPDIAVIMRLGMTDMAHAFGTPVSVESIHWRAFHNSPAFALAQAVRQRVTQAPRSLVESLKEEWLYDPGWDIEDTEGREWDIYRGELKAFADDTSARQERVETKRREDRHLALVARAADLGCSVPVLQVIESLERTVLELSTRLDEIEAR